jgi:predicted transcriptional regulator
LNEHILDYVLTLIEFETNNEVVKLTDHQKTSIYFARYQIEDGQFLTNDEVNNEIDEWLNK